MSTSPRPLSSRRTLLWLLAPLALAVAACDDETALAPTTPATSPPATSPPATSPPATSPPATSPPATDGVEPTSPTSTLPEAITLRDDFDDGSDGWAADVSDYSDATPPEDVLSETGVRPPGLDTTDSTFHLAASNRSDDTFLFMYRSVGPEDGLTPNTTYRIEFEISAASNAPSNCAGIGGAPGESVWLKVGASTERPMPVEDDDGDVRLNVDKGNQSQGGDAADVAGDIANGIPCEEALGAGSPYAMVTWEHVLSHQVETDDAGALWLFVGTDSGFEGRTDLYYDLVEVTMTPEP